MRRYGSLLGEEGDPFGGDGEVIFVFNTEQRLQQVSRSINSQRIIVAVLDQFETLNDAAFSCGGNVTPLFI